MFTKSAARMGMALAVVFVFTGRAALADDFFFHNGDKPIVFLGDSITEQRRYTTLIESFILSRYPHWDVTFRNLGWSGDTVWLGMRGGYETAMQRDIQPMKPAAVTIEFGMNDARGGEDNFRRYVDSMTQLVQQLKAGGARVALISPNSEERYQAGEPGGSNYNLLLWKFTGGMKSVAAREGVKYVDQFTPFMQAIEAGRRSGVLGAEGEPRLTEDGVHPNWAGHLIMASAVLQALGAPSVVSRLQIDAANRRVISQENCRATFVDNPTPTDASPLVFRREDDALPWPVPREALAALKIPGIHPIEDLSQYELTVDGLVAPRYDLWIDDTRVGDYSRAELASSVNLTGVPGPINDQCQKMLDLIEDKNDSFRTRWRGVQAFSIPSWLAGPDAEAKRQSEMNRLDAQIAVQEKQINDLRIPAPHTFKLTPVPPAAPVGLKITALPGKGLQLSWLSPDRTATSFILERSVNAIDYKAIATVGAGANNYLDLEGTPTGNYVYRVRANSRWGTSVPSNVASAAAARTLAQSR